MPNKREHGKKRDMRNYTEHLLKSNGRILLALGLILFLGYTVQAAPTKGRYMWVRCKPDAKNPNCVEESGPWIDLPKSGPEVPSPNADHDLMNKKPVEDESEMTFEESGDDSGKFQEDMAIELGSGSQWNEDLLRASSTAESEEGSADYTEDFPATPEGGSVDYSQFVFADKVPIQQSKTQDLKLHEEGFIL
ncbi:serglycin-like isoform X1 [Acipenser ruthenus]|uniref:serglycin-like isoform X1 n=2 Tax=Acipenser ruthenus TaxID=7906 RepID=UPI0015602DD4|nr:serglycin-like isoform X1 [Acipenser ruthenus]